MPFGIGNFPFFLQIMPFGIYEYFLEYGKIKRNCEIFSKILEKKVTNTCLKMFFFDRVWKL
jgi:hypothetical protein